MTLSHPTPVLVPVPSIPPGTAARAVAAVPGAKLVGTSPICYKKEVTKEMVKAWRQENQ